MTIETLERVTMTVAGTQIQNIGNKIKQINNGCHAWF